MKIFKQALIWVMAIILVIGALSEAITMLQALPLVVYLFLAVFTEYGTSKFRLPIIVIAIIMLIINISMLSGIDIILWSAIAGAYIAE